jgi:3-mercaptopyruvate sulfurtransferase SseA
MSSLPTPIISAEELYLLIDQSNVLIVDCRHDLFDTGAGRRLWAEAALPGAQYLHLDEDLSGPILPGQTGRHPLPETADFAAVMGKLGLEAATYVVVYDDKGGGIAARLWWMLMALGHERVAVLDGGFAKWQAEGRAVVLVVHDLSSVLDQCSHALLLGNGTATSGPVDALLTPDRLVAQNYLSPSQASWMFRQASPASEGGHV